MWRFQSGFRLDGADRVGGSAGYADGSGGRIRARLVRVDKKGRPDLSRVLASETVGAVDRYLQSVALTGTRTMMLYFNMGGVRLKPGRMYAMTYQNVSRHPVQDWFSTNSPTVKASEAGPNGRNTLDPRTPGAIAGLDPREAVAWSTNGGRKVGMGAPGRARASCAGPTPVRGPTTVACACPGMAGRPNRTERARSNQPYYAY